MASLRELWECADPLCFEKEIEIGYSMIGLTMMPGEFIVIIWWEAWEVEAKLE